MNKSNPKKTNSSPEATQTYSMHKDQHSRLLGLKSNALTVVWSPDSTGQWNLPFVNQEFSKGVMLHCQWFTGHLKTLPSLNVCATTKAKAGPMTGPPQSQAPAKELPLPAAFSQEGNPSHHKRKIRK